MDKMYGEDLNTISSWEDDEDCVMYTVQNFGPLPLSVVSRTNYEVCIYLYPE